MNKCIQCGTPCNTRLRGGKLDFILKKTPIYVCEECARKARKHKVTKEDIKTAQNWAAQRGGKTK